MMMWVLPLRPTCTLWKDLMKSCVNLVVIVHCATSACVPVTYDSSSYSYCTDQSTRLQAEVECIVQGSKLLVLETTAEFDFWADQLEKIRSSTVWVGAMWNSTYRAFVWDKTKTRVPASFFIRETTPPHTADCVNFRMTTTLLGLLSGSFKLDIDDCSTRKSYICEESPPAATTEAETTTTAAVTTKAETATAEVATTETTTIEVTTKAEATSTSLSFSSLFESTALATTPDLTTETTTATSTTEEASTKSTTSALQTTITAPITAEVTTDSASLTTETTATEYEKTTQPDILYTPLTDSTATIPSSFLVFNTSVLCVCGNRVDIPRGEEEKEAFVEEQKKKIHTELDVDKETLSSTVRKKISYEDNRPSVTFVGYAGIVFICVILGSILLLDVTRCSAVVETIKACSCSNTETKVTETMP